MAIDIDSYIDVQYSGNTVTRIGLSEGMDQIANEDILDYMFCASYNKIIHGVVPRTENVSMNTYRELLPFSYELDNPYVEINTGGYDHNPAGMYMGVIWLYTDIFANHPENNGNLSHFKIVMDWDAPNYYTTVPAPNGRRDNITSWTAGDGTGCYATTGTISSLTYVYNNHDISVADIYPYMIFKTTDGSGELLFISALRQNANTFRCRPFTKGNQIRFIGTTTLKSFRNNEQTYSPVGPCMTSYGKALPYRWNMGASAGQASANPNAYGDTAMTNVFLYTEGGSNAGSVIGSMDWLWFLNTRDESLLFWASGGLKFKAGSTIYKPIIESGLVTGFSDDMSTPSDLDNWSGTTKHRIPVTPPSPSGTDEDNADPISTVGAPYAKGLVNYYAMTAGSPLLDHISEALSTWDLQNTGKDLYKNLVSCKLIKPPAAIPTTGSEPLTIYGEKPQYQGADISLPVVSGNPDASFGPYNIARKYNDFRDYAPYTRVNIYLPYCGWCDLPSHVVGRSISVKYYTDIIAATVRAVVFCENNIIAEAAGVMGLDIPFTADAVGMKQAGVVSGLTAYAGGALQTAAGVAQLVISKDAKGLSNVFSGGSKLLSAYTQTAEAFNENTTEISGKNGDGCCLSGATNIIIKIIRPKYGASSTAPFVPAGFAHSIGFVSNKQVRVGNISGLLIADNVDTSGIAGATDAERAEIKRVLETGLIVNAAPVP